MGMIGNSLAQGLISGANIQDGTVDTPDIKDSAVTAAKIASAVVTPAKMDFSAGTANGLLYLNGSKVASSGSVLVFDGTNVGIGNTSPSRKLYVQSDDSSTGGNVVAVRNANTTAGAFINFLGGGSNAPSIGAKNNAIVFTADGYSGAEWARFDASGNLFVGATGSSMSGTPKLIAKGTNSTNGLVQFENSVNTSDVNHGIINLINTATGATGNDARVMFSLRNVGASSGLDPMASIGAVKEAADYAAAIQFNTRSSAGAFSEKARIDSSGKLLLGTTTSATTQLTVGGVANIGIVGSNAAIHFGAAGSPAGSGGFSTNPCIARAADANYHISGSAIGDFCIGPEGGKRILFGYGATQGNGLNIAMIVNSSGSVQVTGALSKGSGSFRINHPLPELEATHQLVHSFIEGPQADNLYRGKVILVDGVATVNIDVAAGMTDGTFVLLNREVQCFTTNETGWVHVRGSVAENVLTIEAQDNTCTDTISWMVIGERKDKHMYDTDWTDENGKVIVEPLKDVRSEPPEPTTEEQE